MLLQVPHLLQLSFGQFNQSSRMLSCLCLEYLAAIVEMGLKWLVVFVFLKYSWDAQEEHENHKKFIITFCIIIIENSRTTLELCWCCISNSRNTVKLESCYDGNSRDTTELGCCQVSNSSNTVKFRKFYVNHCRNTVKCCAEQC